MEASKQFALNVHQKLVPIEDDVYKFEDVTLFLKRRKSAFLFFLINLIFFLIYMLHLPAYTLIFSALGLYFASPLYFPIIKPLLRKLVLGKKVKNLPPDAPRRRYTIQEISAFLGVIHYRLHLSLQKARIGIIKRNYFFIATTLFILNFFFYVFLSMSDAFALFAILNGVMLLPFLLQQHVSRSFVNIQERVANVTNNFAIQSPKKQKVE